MTETPSPQTSKSVVATVKRLFRNVFWVALTVFLCFGIYLITRDSTSTTEQKAASIGASFVASTLFAAAFWLIVEKQGKELLQSELSGQLREELKNQFEDLSRAIRQPSTDYALDELFPSSGQHFDSRFLRSFLPSFRATSHFNFRGSSAKYVPVYMSILKKSDFRCSLLLIDPRNDSALDVRALDMNPTMGIQEKLQHRARLRDDIHDTIVALFDERRRCNRLEVGFAHLTSVSRIEKLDADLFLGIYRQGQNYPDILRYSRERATYQFTEKEFSRQFLSLSQDQSFDLTNMDADDDLVRLLKHLGFQTASSDLPAVRQRNSLRVEKFTRRCKQDCGFDPRSFAAG